MSIEVFILERLHAAIKQVADRLLQEAYEMQPLDGDEMDENIVEGSISYPITDPSRVLGVRQ